MFAIFLLPELERNNDMQKYYLGVYNHTAVYQKL